MNKTIDKLLKQGVSMLNETSDTPLLDAQLILGFLLECDRIYLIVNNKQKVSSDIASQYEQWIQKRAKGYPVQYITNYQEFMGLDFYVNESTLIPRGDTEILVEYLINQLKGHSVDVLEIGVGSGAISIALAKYLEASVVGVDISQSALDIANKNACINDVTSVVEFIQSDLFSNVGDKQFDVIVSNPPYIPTKDIEQLKANVRDYEPRLALDGGQDGYDFYRRIINAAHKYLKHNGILAFEIGYDQGPKIAGLMKERYTDIQIIKDLGQKDRVVVGKKCEV